MMDSIPEDISNKKFISPSVSDVKTEEPVEKEEDDSKSEVEPVKEKPEPKSVKPVQKTKKEKIDSKKSKTSFTEKKTRFMEEKYPLIYAKVYDIYNFKLVENNYLDKILKISIIFTLVILLIICAVIFYQIADLAL